VARDSCFLVSENFGNKFATGCQFFFYGSRIKPSRHLDWVFQTGCCALGFTCNDWGTLRPCLFPPMAVKSKPPAMQMVVDSADMISITINAVAEFCTSRGLSSARHLRAKS
jgi:hypothetical protein